METYYDGKRVYQTKDAAHAIGISEAVLRNLARRGDVKYKRRGTGRTCAMYFPADEIERLKRDYSPVAV